MCSTNWLGHGHGYKWHSSNPPAGRQVVRAVAEGHVVASTISNSKQLLHSTTVDSNS